MSSVDEEEEDEEQEDELDGNTFPIILVIFTKYRFLSLCASNINLLLVVSLCILHFSPANVIHAPAFVSNPMLIKLGVLPSKIHTSFKFTMILLAVLNLIIAVPSTLTLESCSPSCTI
jgi:hypothetical protein